MLSNELILAPVFKFLSVLRLRLWKRKRAPIWIEACVYFASSNGSIWQTRSTGWAMILQCWSLLVGGWTQHARVNSCNNRYRATSVFVQPTAASNWIAMISLCNHIHWFSFMSTQPAEIVAVSCVIVCVCVSCSFCISTTDHFLTFSYCSFESEQQQHRIDATKLIGCNKLCRELGHFGSMSSRKLTRASERVDRRHSFSFKTNWNERKESHTNRSYAIQQEWTRIALCHTKPINRFLLVQHQYNSRYSFPVNSHRIFNVRFKLPLIFSMWASEFIDQAR